MHIGTVDVRLVTLLGNAFASSFFLFFLFFSLTSILKARHKRETVAILKRPGKLFPLPHRSPLPEPHKIIPSSILIISISISISISNSASHTFTTSILSRHSFEEKLSSFLCCSYSCFCSCRGWGGVNVKLTWNVILLLPCPAPFRLRNNPSQLLD